MYLNELVVAQQHRRDEIGRELFVEVARYAKELDCSVLDLHILKTNPDVKFYQNLYAANFTEKTGYELYVLNVNDIEIE